MKTKRTIRSIAAVCLVALIAGGILLVPRSLAQDAGPRSRIGVCDILKILKEYDRFADIKKDFEGRGVAIRDESEKRRARLQSMDEELKGLAPGSKDFEALRQKMQKVAVEAQVWQKYQISLAEYDHSRLMVEMYGEVLDMVKVIADERGLDIVLFRDARDTQADSVDQLLAKIENRKVLYSSPDIDTTATVLARLNRAYATKSR
ncbi:MAG: OmpH/Skp family outer membrane protein [Planctomycetota bacterium]|jgi:Skp family chaperone for outer membrane proteins